MTLARYHRITEERRPMVELRRAGANARDHDYEILCCRCPRTALRSTC